VWTEEVSLAGGLLPGVKVLELGGRVSAPYCAKVLANLGADVIKVEPPNGDEARRMGPFPGDANHNDKSGLFLALNANKRGMTLDLDEPDDARRLLALAEDADIVVENLPPGEMERQGLGYEVLREGRPEIIVTSITPFGRKGPYAGYKATDLVLYHMAGLAHGLLGPVEDPDREPPVRAGGHQAELVAGMAGATASMMALYRRRMVGTGCHVTVSSFDAAVTQVIAGLANCALGRPAPTRDLARQEEAAIGGMVAAVGGVLPCTDGYVAISPREDAQWERWLELMGNPDWSSDERFATRDARQRNFPELWELVGDWTRHRSKYDIARDGQERRIPCFPVNTVEDLLKDPHLEAREFFVTIDHPVAGSLKYPGVPYKLSNTALSLDARPAPMLGEHNGLGWSGAADG
jgi:crotonobetainyl-CoA:carnitine CoA-transferase CaiB-like acyl-CoA transferase